MDLFVFRWIVAYVAVSVLAGTMAMTMTEDGRPTWKLWARSVGMAAAMIAGVTLCFLLCLWALGEFD